jgi:Flp pilus assembly protein TadG
VITSSHTLSAFASRARRDECGTVAMIFGLSVFVLFGAAGIGLDAIRAHRVATRAASALDAAALAAAKAMNEQDDLADGQLRQIAIDYYNANTQAYVAQGVTSTIPVVTITRAQSKVQLTASFIVPTTLGKVVNVDRIEFTKTGTVIYDMKRIELAMVLDVTGSMNDGGKLGAMKTAAKDVIDVLVDPSKSYQARVALVPYSASVNMGAYKDQASGGDSLDGCVMERLTAPPRDTDDPPGAGGYNFAVQGQLNSGSNSKYVCPPAVVMPLSYDRDLLRSTVDSYGAAGWTAGHIGLAWGWNIISDRWTGVFTGASAPGSRSDSRYVKSILLMTDGIFNTSYSAGTSDAAQIAESTARTLALCSNIKAQGIRIYTVAFQAPADAETLLRACASSAGDYYDANDANQLRDSFRDIATKLQNLRVSN